MSTEYGASSIKFEDSNYVINYDLKPLIIFLSKVVEVILNGDKNDINKYILSSDDCLFKCEKFISDTSLTVLYIVKNVKENSVDGLGNNYVSYSYDFNLELSPRVQTTAILALIKLYEEVNLTIPLENQLQLLNMPGWIRDDVSSTSLLPYKALHTLIRSAVSPYFDAFTKEKEKGQENTKSLNNEYRMGIPAAKKKIAELELSLLDLQQDIEIPNISLTVHPEVEKFILEANKQNMQPLIQNFPSNLLTNSTFLNNLQSNVNSWIKSIQAITRISHDPTSGSASQEINFWLNMEASLQNIEEQLKSDGVLLTLEILKQAKRFHTTVSFTADTGLKETNEKGILISSEKLILITKVNKYNQLMKEFPLNELLSATSLDKVQKSIFQIFNHLNKKLRICPYPISRVLPLVEAISSDLNTRIQSLLGSQKFMHLEYTHFMKLMRLADEVFKTWDDQLKEFTNMARDVTRKRSEKFIPIKITSQHIKTQERLAYIKTFRQGHEQLRSTIFNVLETSKMSSDENYTRLDGIEDIDIMNEISESYSLLKTIDVLDISPEGTRQWIITENNYNDRISRIENTIINKLRDKLSAAKTSREMFIVFSKFNPLFIRPKIRGAIQEYQVQLINNVKSDITNLHERFKKRYNNSESYLMAQLYDIPPISGAIIWARQIERQLDTYIKNIENVLGKDWELYADAKKLQSDTTIFKNKLNAYQIYEAWLHDISKKKFSITGRLFKIIRKRTLDNALELVVNFDHQIIILFKEVRNLLWLNFSIPHSINSISKEAKRVYPYVVSLTETLRNYLQTDERTRHINNISILLAGYQNDIQNFISKGMNLKWESFIHSYDSHIRSLDYTNIDKHSGIARKSRYVLFVQDFSKSVSTLQEKINILLKSHDTIFKNLENLNTCAYDQKAFSSILENIQKEIDLLSFENFSNLSFWVDDLNSKIENILIQRIIRSAQIWVKTFISFKTADSDFEKEQKDYIDSCSSDYDDHAFPTFEKFTYKIHIRNQLISLEPSIEFSKLYWFRNFHNWIDIACNQKKIFAFKYRINFDLDASIDQNSEAPTYRYLLSKVYSPHLSNAYSSILEVLNEVNAYVEKWLQFQSLWDLQLDHVYNFLGNDLSKWLQILREIQKSRSTFDTTKTSHSFGFLIVDYEQVQNRINSKYDSWQKNILNKFSTQLSDNMKEFYAQITKMRHTLESQSLEGSTEETISFITNVEQFKKQMEESKKLVSLYQQGQTVLFRQRYHFDNDWLYIDQIEGEWGMLSDILSRKDKLITDHIDVLKTKIIAQDQIISSKISLIINDWNEQKPVSGDLDPSSVFDTLSKFESKINQIDKEKKSILKAKEALNLDTSGGDIISAILEEVMDFKSVWSAINTLWKSLNELMETPWNIVIPRKIRQSLDKLLNITKEMPSSMRQYLAFEHMQNLIRQYIKANSLISELKIEAMKERHWEKLFKLLKPKESISFSSLNIGNVWKLNLINNEHIIKNVISEARGEMALEEFLKNIRETWSNYYLNLINYRNVSKLINNWDDLFTKCVDNLNSLSAMKSSPYYKMFQEDASSWDYRLNKIHILFDIWSDVQRQWVYLEGIFSGNTDIKHLLPIESQRFQNISSEFLAIMKKVCKSPSVLDVLAIPNIHKSMERLLDLLQKIQKALGEYLEKERILFPRFYFIGDEDLLEMIGNSKDINRIQKHFCKMFSGIHNLILDKDSATITGFSSKEGEIVFLKTPINLLKTQKINEWLDLLDISVKNTLSDLLIIAINDFENLYRSSELKNSHLLDFFDKYPSQIIILSLQILWTKNVEIALSDSNMSEKNLQDNLFRINTLLTILATLVVNDINTIQRKKSENIITYLVHQKDIINMLLKEKVTSVNDFRWQFQMRFALKDYSDPKSLLVLIGNVSFNYGFEYLGISDRLVQTPLNDKCFLTLTQALKQKLGGSPFGPAGTGKTESVKALGAHLGKFVLVFCCDSTFDFQAIERIILGICQVGAWGCFDEFNRLEEKILSAISQQIQTIQLGLKNSEGNKHVEVELLDKKIKIHPETGIFITMNPGYAGRSNLPDNLKKLFRSISMTRPDKETIAQVTLYSQGFSMAKELASNIVPFFEKCSTELSSQSHYDFGLRALKGVLIISGNIKRSMIQNKKDNNAVKDILETEIIVQSLRRTILPKLIKNDLHLLMNIEKALFPNVNYIPPDLSKLEEEIRKVSSAENLFLDDEWITKILQLYQIQCIHYGIIIVGSSGTGKSKAWRTLLKSLKNLNGTEFVYHIIDPKVFSKEVLYGNLDSITREWTDGLFTSIIRKIVNNLRGEQFKKHWIIFDGDIDPEWAENLNRKVYIINFVLDDNKLLTLPNGERLSISDNIRIVFEVDSLKYATLATISRCGMIWFDEQTVKPNMILYNRLNLLHSSTFEQFEDDNTFSIGPSNLFTIQRIVADILNVSFLENGLVIQAIEYAQNLDHIMNFTPIRSLNTLFTFIHAACKELAKYNSQHEDFPLTNENIEAYISKKLLLYIIWSFSGDCKFTERKKFEKFIIQFTTTELPVLSNDRHLLDYDVSLPYGNWDLWETKVPIVEVDIQSVFKSNYIVPTVDTLRHESLIYSFLLEHKPFILCGPPGSGKTTILLNVLQKISNIEPIVLNFSSNTSPDLIIKTLEQYCEYTKTVHEVIMRPKSVGKWIVIFCDEINLPSLDTYGTQRVIFFIRQLIEHEKFWNSKIKAWIKLERIQFIGSCNPPKDIGRVAFSNRFLWHFPVIMVDYPERISLIQIYEMYNKTILKCIPELRSYYKELTYVMVDFYLLFQQKFTPNIQTHYVYSPRELTRWIRNVYGVIFSLETMTLDELVRFWFYESLRLFQDRLVSDDEKEWTENTSKEMFLKHFLNISDSIFNGPILYSNWLSKNYMSVNKELLRDYFQARLKTFCEEEIDVPLILFDDILDHVLRIDRAFHQTQGHLIFIGISGSGKTTLSRFVSWMNGLKIFQIKVHSKYSSNDFDNDLRDVLRRAGCKGEKICFLFDESNVLSTSFLERMNTLLANSEIASLFEGDEFTSLISSCKEATQKEGLLLDSQDELYNWFSQQISRNLHIVFTMNPLNKRSTAKVSTSPALFNRCIINWLGDWSIQSFYEVANELIRTLDLEKHSYVSPLSARTIYLQAPFTYREAIVDCIVFIHYSMKEFNEKSSEFNNKIYVTPRHFISFVRNFVQIYMEKREELEDQQQHLNSGIEKLNNTVNKVFELKEELAEKQQQLELKNKEANDKLKRIVEDQKEAEERKAASLEIQEYLYLQEEEINVRRKMVIDDLAKAEPAVIEAQRSVSSIKKQHLTEVRSMTNPPEAVKLTMESVCTLLGQKFDNWKTVQGIIRKDDFISNILNFDNDKQMTKALRTKMQTSYISNPNFTFDIINHASKACGPLVLWVCAQVNYSTILEKVAPLREEVNNLEIQVSENKAKVENIISTIQELEKNILLYKEEYATLISDIQTIKSEMSHVQQKVDRSLELLNNLSSERNRWELESQTFENRLDTLAGDVLLSSAFLTYAGIYDQQARLDIQAKWRSQLQSLNISTKKNNPVSEYLVTLDEKSDWFDNSLPQDELCVENALILKRSDRYPLIIDPSNCVTQYLIESFKERKLTITSFLDDTFVKHLESALRFGNPILIQDAEYLDPILYPILNKEYQRTDGRILVQLGKQNIDFSPSFKLFLLTKNSSINFGPEISSRVTFVNFTITTSSLQSQCLNKILYYERPDVDQRRNNSIKLQNKFRLHLMHLEKNLLNILNESQGNILSNDSVLKTLESLKKEASEISKKASETEEIIKEIEQITLLYRPVVSVCSSIFEIMEQLVLISPYYNFSLLFFQDIFYDILNNNEELKKEMDFSKRINILLRDIMLTTFKRVSRALLHKHHIFFGLLIARLAILTKEIKGFDNNIFELLFSSEIPENDFSENPSSIDIKRYKAPYFHDIDKYIDGNSKEFNLFLTVEKAEDYVPILWDYYEESLNNSVRKLLIIKMFRMDRLIPAIEKFITDVFEENVFSHIFYDIKSLVENESTPQTPIVSCSVPGYDASYKIENFVNQVSVDCESITMGSIEGLTQADREIILASQKGTWILLKNVHLTTSWLDHLEKKLQNLKHHPKFRLFVTMEMSLRQVPINLLRMSRIMMFEPPPGIKASMLNTFGSIPISYFNDGPIEKNRLYFLLSWFHALVQERLRYIPLGWSKLYEFNDSDFESAIWTINRLIKDLAHHRSNISPEKIPWEAIRLLLYESIYGSKLDDENDLESLNKMIQSIFRPESFNLNYELVEKHLVIPDCLRREEFLNWIQSLPERQSPTWLGLPEYAEKVILFSQGKEMLDNCRIILNVLRRK